jgi:hypothetical protein
LRTLGTAIGLGILVLLPALCLAGLLAHPCDCPAGEICQHESSCDADPCADGALREVASQRLSLDPLFLATPTHAIELSHASDKVPHEFARDLADRLPRRSPGAQLPLLI